MCKRSFHHVLCVLLGGLFLASGVAFSAEFTADMTESQGDYVNAGKLSVKGPKYCMELEQEGEKVKVIVDTEANKTVVLNVSKKEFREMAADDMNSIMNDPFQGYQFMVKRGFGVEKSAGIETVEGLECKKHTLMTEDSTELLSKWVSTKLDFQLTMPNLRFRRDLRPGSIRQPFRSNPRNGLKESNRRRL